MKNGKAACREYTSFSTSRKPFDAQCACAWLEVNAGVSARVTPFCTGGSVNNSGLSTDTASKS